MNLSNKNPQASTKLGQERNPAPKSSQLKTHFFGIKKKDFRCVDKNCIFCKIVSGEASSYKIWENAKILAFLDMNPVNPGHVLVIPKEHYDDFTSIPNDMVCKMMILAKKISAVILESGMGEATNFQINNGRIAGQAVGHFHLHIMPRKSGDGKKLWKGKPYLAGEAEKVLEKLTAAKNGQSAKIRKVK